MHVYQFLSQQVENAVPLQEAGARSRSQSNGPRQRRRASPKRRPPPSPVRQPTMFFPPAPPITGMRLGCIFIMSKPIRRHPGRPSCWQQRRRERPPLVPCAQLGFPKSSVPCLPISPPPGAIVAGVRGVSNKPPLRCQVLLSHGVLSPQTQEWEYLKMSDAQA